MVCVNMECKGGDFSMHFRAMDSRSGSLMNWERIVVPLAIQTYWMSSGLVIIDWVFFFSRREINWLKLFYGLGMGFGNRIEFGEMGIENLSFLLGLL